MNHKTIFLNKAIEYLNIKPDGIYVDGTLGGGGHSLKIVKQLNSNGFLLSIDQDYFSLKKSKIKLKSFSQIEFINDNFSNLEQILKQRHINFVDGIILDLGISSFQIDDPDRGFSYNKNAILDMRMNQKNELTAKIIVNSYSFEKLLFIFKNYGEEYYSNNIAKSIIKNRNKKLINTTFELVEIIKSALPEKEKRKKGHPARKIFQSLRIEVNKELESLKKVLNSGEKVLKQNGNFVIITFHSLEDRIVKHFFNKKENPCTCPSDFPICICHKKPTFKHLTKKVCLPEKKEILENNRARSAKLRVAKRI